MAERYVPAAGRAWLTGGYDAAVALTMRERRWRPALVAAVGADVPRGGAAVEVGCGTGALAIELARARPDIAVTGVDGDDEILALARRKRGAERVRWQHALADDLPLADGSADAALCSLLLHHLSDEVKRAAFGEITRVLSPSGVLHVADWGPPGGPAAALGARALQVIDTPEDARTLLGGGMRTLLESAGFGPARRWRTLRTVWGTLELWRAPRQGRLRP